MAPKQKKTISSGRSAGAGAFMPEASTLNGINDEIGI
jgi:hypothetical protein